MEIEKRMSVMQWFEKGWVLPEGDRIASLYVHGNRWQLYTTEEGGYALAVTEDLYVQWIRRDLLEEGLMLEEGEYYVISVPQGQMLSSVEYGPFCRNSREAESFARALKAGMERTGVSLADGLFIERFQLILPAFVDKGSGEAGRIIGRWISGGMNISLTDTDRIRRYAPWLGEGERQDLLVLFGLSEDEGKENRTALDMPASIDSTWKRAGEAGGNPDNDASASSSRHQRKPGPFVLHGRKTLEKYIKEEILDLIDREEEYRRFGVGFPGATLLYGPAGSGKTFAVEQLADYLGWPVFRITSTSVGSKYIHESGRKISNMFDAAIREAPSILIIDELEAFLSPRESLSGNVRAHMEEVGEFLRRIPEAADNHVLLFGMTNMLDSIDRAFLRKGRFDHIIKVDMPSSEEVLEVLESSLAGLPAESSLQLDTIARMLEGRPLSDVAYVIKEAGRRCVQAGRKYIGYEDLKHAAESLDGKQKKGPFGFM